MKRYPEWLSHDARRHYTKRVRQHPTVDRDSLAMLAEIYAQYRAAQKELAAYLKEHKTLTVACAGGMKQHPCIHTMAQAEARYVRLAHRLGVLTKQEQEQIQSELDKMLGE